MAEAYKCRLKKLERKVKSSQGADFLYNGKTPIGKLTKNLNEAEACLELLPEFDDGKALPQLRMVSFARSLTGLPSEPIPSEMKVLAWSMLKVARVMLAEALEAQEKHEEALPLYHVLIDQTLRMRMEVWESDCQVHLMMNNLGLCYKRAGKFEDAILWYQKGLRMCERDPGFGGARDVEDQPCRDDAEQGRAP